MAQIPDFGSLAGQQYQANTDAANRTNIANRPNQYNPMGSVTWGMNPDGSWSQNTQLADWTKPLYNQTIDSQIALGTRVGAGAPEASFGADQRVIDAWQALQQPGLDRDANAARARAAAMGITLGSEANNDIERQIGTNAATSRNQGILQGVQAARGLYADQLAGFNSNVGAMGAMTGVRDSLNPNKWAASVPTSATYTPQTIYGSAMDTFNANLANENKGAIQASQDQARTAAIWAALLGNRGLTDAAISGAQSIWNNW